MRGADEQAGSMFRYVSLEEQASGAPAARYADHRSGAGAAVATLRRAVCDSAVVDSPREAVRALLLRRCTRSAANDSSWSSSIQCCSLVVGLGMDDAVWSPTTLRDRDRCSRGTWPPRSEAVLIHADTERLLSNEHSRWTGHAGGVGEPEEFRPRSDSPADGGANPAVNSTASGAAATQRRPRIPTPGCIEGARARGATGLSGPPADGASVGPDRQRDRDTGGWLQRTRCGAGDDRGYRGGMDHRGGRQGLRHPRLVSITRAMQATPTCPSRATGHRRSAIDGRTTHRPV